MINLKPAIKCLNRRSGVLDTYSCRHLFKLIFLGPLIEYFDNTNHVATVYLYDNLQHSENHFSFTVSIRINFHSNLPFFIEINMVVNMSGDALWISELEVKVNQP